MRKNKGLLKFFVILGVVFLLTANPKVTKAGKVYTYNDLNRIIMEEDVRKGKKDLAYYNWLEEEISSLSNKEERRILELKFDAILLRYGDSLQVNNYKGHQQLLFGDTNNRLNLNRSITREEAATIVYRAEPNVKIEKKPNYSDVKKTRWSFKYIDNINSNGNNNKFRPTDKITRAEALALIEKNFTLKKSNQKLSFRDIKGHWAESIIRDYSGTIVQGSGNGRFRPDDYISRAEFIVMINRASRNCTLNENEITKSVKQKYQRDLDVVPWARDYILEALIDH